MMEYLFVRVARADGATLLKLAHSIQSAAAGGMGTPPEPVLLDQQRAVESRRFIALVFALFASFALLLSSVGVYAVLNYSVGQRTREFAMRMALGSTRGAVVRIVLRDATVMVLAVTAFGAIGAMVGGRLLGRCVDDVYP